MYRDDVCAVCGESLPPNHFYCREHGAVVDERLQALGTLLGDVIDDLGHLARLLDQVAPETWDYLAEQEDDDPDWPPVPHVVLLADAEEVSVDVDAEPGMVRVTLDVGLQPLLAALARGLDAPSLHRLAAAAATAKGANATH